MKEKNIQELAIRMGLISVEDMCQYTISQLVIMVANKVNELVSEVWRFETDVQETLKTQNENIQYLMGEGLHLEVENIFDGWVKDGTFDTLINQTALKNVNNRIDETNAQLSDINVKKSDRADISRLQSQINSLVLGATGDGNNAEVVQARGKYDVLNDRFKDNEFNLNLTQNITSDYVNLFNLYDNGFYVDANDGELKSNSLTSTTKFIDLDGIYRYIFTYVGKNETHQMAFYDANYTYVSGEKTTVVGEWVIAIPSNARYCKVSFYNDFIESFYVKGMTKVKAYIDKKVMAIDSVVNGNNTADLLNPLNSTNGCFIGSGFSNDELGKWIERADVSQSEFLPVVGYESVNIVIPTVATNTTHQWVFKNSKGLVFTGGWKKGEISDNDVTVNIPIPSGAISFSCAYLTKAPIKIHMKAVGLVNKIEDMVTSSHLKGKKVGIIGDSISTYKDYIKSGYSHFYPRGDVQSVNDTWWKKLIDNTGMELCVNCSWSGSTITGNTDSLDNAYCGASEKRVNDLTKTDGTIPDIIITNISINDFGKNNNITVGDSVGNEPIAQSGTLNKISESYVLLIKKLMTKYPKARIYCCTVMAEQFESEMSGSYTNGYPNINPNDNVTLPSWNNMIREIANNMGCGIIDMAKCGINYFNLSSYTIDRLHPNVAGHELMYLQAKKDMM